MARQRTPDHGIDEADCVAALQRLASHVDGAHVLYGTRYSRPEGKIKGTSTGALAKATAEAALKAASKALATGLPNEGWVIMTPEGIHVFAKKTLVTGVGAHKGTIPLDLVRSVRVAHGKKPTATEITITFVDESNAVLKVKTTDTYPALSLWARSLADRAPAADETPAFDSEALYRESTGLSH